MYVDEKRVNQLAEQINAAFKAQELAMEELRAEIKVIRLQQTNKKPK